MSFYLAFNDATECDRLKLTASAAEAAVDVVYDLSQTAS